MTVSWGYSVGSVRAKETALFRNQDITQMLSLETEKQLALFLHDKGYGSAIVDASVSGIVKAETEKLWAYADEVAADKDIFRPLILDNDYHNLKAVIKGVLSGKDYSRLLISPSTVGYEEIEFAVKNNKFDVLPPFMAADAAAAYDVLAHTSDAQLADGILDVSRMKASYDAASMPLLKRYISEKIFYENVKTALRAAKAGKDAHFTERVLWLPNGTKELANATLSGTEKVLDWLEADTQHGGAGAVEAYKKSTSEFEKYADDRLMEIAREGKRVTLGAEVLVGYVLARLAEIKAVSMIALGIRTESGEAAVRERLRELYD